MIGASDWFIDKDSVWSSIQTFIDICSFHVDNPAAFDATDEVEHSAGAPCKHCNFRYLYTWSAQLLIQIKCKFQARLVRKVLGPLNLAKIIWALCSKREILGRARREHYLISWGRAIDLVLNWLSSWRQQKDRIKIANAEQIMKTFFDLYLQNIVSQGDLLTGTDKR